MPRPSLERPVNPCRACWSAFDFTTGMEREPDDDDRSTRTCSIEERRGVRSPADRL
jgi:hypothetical protein